MNDIERAIEGLRGLSERLSESSELFKERHGKNFDLAISALEKQLNGGWIPFKEEHDEDSKMDTLQGKIPDEEQEVFVTNGKNVWVDTFMRDGMECYLDSGHDLIADVVAWKPLPEPYKEVDNE